jgi:hypothetical protein
VPWAFCLRHGWKAGDVIRPGLTRPIAAVPLKHIRGKGHHAKEFNNKFSTSSIIRRIRCKAESKSRKLFSKMQKILFWNVLEGFTWCADCYVHLLAHADSSDVEGNSRWHYELQTVGCFLFAPLNMFAIEGVDDKRNLYSERCVKCWLCCISKYQSNSHIIC